MKTALSGVSEQVSATNEVRLAGGLSSFGKSEKLSGKSVVGHFTYRSSQPKNSRFQTSEFWGLKT